MNVFARRLIRNRYRYGMSRGTCTGTSDSRDGSHRGRQREIGFLRVDYFRRNVSRCAFDLVKGARRKSAKETERKRKVGQRKIENQLRTSDDDLGPRNFRPGDNIPLG